MNSYRSPIFLICFPCKRVSYNVELWWGVEKDGEVDMSFWRSPHFPLRDSRLHVHRTGASSCGPSDDACWICEEYKYISKKVTPSHRFWCARAFYSPTNRELQSKHHYVSPSLFIILSFWRLVSLHAVLLSSHSQSLHVLASPVLGQERVFEVFHGHISFYRAIILGIAG